MHLFIKKGISKPHSGRLEKCQKNDETNETKLQQDRVASTFINPARCSQSSQVIRTAMKRRSSQSPVPKTKADVEVFGHTSNDNHESVSPESIGLDCMRFDQCIVFDQKLLLHDGEQSSKSAEYSEKLHDVLSRALGDRARSVHLYADREPPSGADNGSQTKTLRGNSVRIGLHLNSHQTGRLVDHGPPAGDQTVARKFRNFWGEKAELRRFKDGSITESLIWSERSPVVVQIVSYILKRHFKIEPESLDFVGNQFEHRIISQNDLVPRRSAFKIVNDSFQNLASKISQLQGLPLAIRSILPVSPQLSCTSLASPLISTPLLPIDILIEFEGSGRWPDSLPAIQRTKVAFLVKLCELLHTSDAKLDCRVGVENAGRPFANPTFLDVILPSPQPGVVPPIPFRLRIRHDRTHTLLQKAVADSTSFSRPQLTVELQSFMKENLASPLHATTFATLCTRFPTLTYAIQFLKSWIASHHLSSQLPEAVLDILAALPYLHSHPYSSPPHSALTAFFRTLDLIADWDWEEDPLLVDLSGNPAMNDAEELDKSFAPGRVEQFRTRFAAWRKQLDPGLNSVVWFVGTNIDETGVVWTQGGSPSRVVAGRVTALAKASRDIIKQTAKGQDLNNKTNLSAKKTNKQHHLPGKDGSRPGLHPPIDAIWDNIFKSPLTDFDFVIHLHDTNHDTKAIHNDVTTTKFKNLSNLSQMASLLTSSSSSASVIDRLSFDPVRLYLEDLNRVFNSRGGATMTTSSGHQSNNVLFFYGSDHFPQRGSPQIAGLWNPRIFPPETATKIRWKVNLAYSSIPRISATDDKNHSRELKALSNGDISHGINGNEDQQDMGTSTWAPTEQRNNKRQQMERAVAGDAGKEEPPVQACLNHVAMLKEMECLGRGLVDRIEVFR